ncbi:MAG: hypothetical protein RL518_2019 [Pseudomonadota bacterium]
MRPLLILAVLAVFTLHRTEEARSDDWSFVIAPYALMPNISGDASVGRVDDVDVDVSTGDILDSLDLGAMLQLEARHPSNFGAMVNYAFMDLGENADGPLGFTHVQADIFQGILEGFGTYRFVFEKSTLDAYAGARWWDINLDVDADTPLGSRSYTRDEDWVDPVFGARWLPRIGTEWRLLLQGDVGGFGAASQFSWCAQAGILWDLSDTTSVTVLYKALGVDYHSGAPNTSSYFEYDTVTQGPLLGVVFRL